MKRRTGNYYAEVLKRERINDLKCYFVQSNNPDFRYDDYGIHYIDRQKDKIERRNNLIRNNADIIARNFKEEVGFALVWKPDLILGEIRKDLRGMGIRGYKFCEKSTFCTVEEIPVKNLCQLNMEIMGAESAILRESESKEAYLSTWCLQSRFRQRHGFEL